ncbi:MAG: tetratricopeptide repeat protein, partial [Desulfosarcinaceae bacterium]
MLGKYRPWLAVGLAAFLASACSGAMAPVNTTQPMHHLIAAVQKSVVTIRVYDAGEKVVRLGSGFFIDREGTLVTNDHVMEGAYKADVRTADGASYPILTMVARSQLVDLVKVRVEIPPDKIVPLAVAGEEPAVADRVVVIGSPMGLEQTVSEGIISALRNHPAHIKIYQVTAPISPGSSGGPALNLRGEVIGVVTFQAATGQNLNFAVSIKALQMLTREPEGLSLAEWTIRKTGPDPALAVSLCRKGARLSIKGEYEDALEFYRKAAQRNPEDPDAWYGLGSCYVGLKQADNALAAYQQSIAVAPDNAAGHFMLALYHLSLEQFEQAIPSLKQVIRIDPANIPAYTKLAEAYGKLERPQDEIETLKLILAIKPDHVPTLHRMGNTMGRIGRYDEALDLLGRASALAPDNAWIHFDMGLAYHFKKMPG